MMSNLSRKLVELLATKINKSPTLTNAIEAATERAQVQFSNIQNVATKKYDTIVKQVNGATIIQDLRSAALEPVTPIPKQLVAWWKWYQHLTGLEDVEMARQQMIHVQDKLFDCQNHRRDLTHQSALIADKLKDVYAELVQTQREDPKYVQLTIMENKGLQEKTRIMSQLNLLENEERDYFTQLATAIKEYHDSQNINAQKYKYLSILASAIIAILSLGGSIIYNNKRIVAVHKVIEEGQGKNESLFRSYFDSLKHSIDELKNEKKTIIVPLSEVPEVIPNNVDLNISPLEKKIILGCALVSLIYVVSRIT